MTFEIHGRRRDKEGRKEATRGGRWTPAEDQDIPKLENALKFGGRRLDGKAHGGALGTRYQFRQGPKEKGVLIRSESSGF